MKKKALVLALGAALATPVVALAQVNYAGEKLSGKFGPNYVPTEQTQNSTQVETLDEVANASKKDGVPLHLQDEPNAAAQKEKAGLAASRDKKNKKNKKNEQVQEAVPHSSALPVTVFGDQVIYHQDTGNFEATGKVRIYQGTQKLFTTKVEGNIKTGDIYLNQGGRLVEDGTVTEGKWVHYNFLEKTGNLKDIKGDNGKDRYAAEEGQMFPDRVELNKGATTTSCVAVKHTHCFDVKAEKVIIYPNDKIIAYDVKVYLKGKHIYSRDRWINDLTSDDEQSFIPRPGYSKKHGVELKYNYQHVFTDKNSATAELKYYSKIGWRPLFSDVQDERNFYVRVQNGHTEDDDNNWVKKERDVTLGYKSHKFTDHLPLNYSAYVSRGLWTDKYRSSWHTEMGFFITHDRINFFGEERPLHLDLGTGYKITRESVLDEPTKTMLYSATLGKNLAGGWNSWLGYYWEKNQNRLFAYNLPDMARELQLGISKQIDHNNNLTLVSRYDEGKHRLYENIWRLTHDFCCWRLTLEYRDKKYSDEKEWSVNYDLYRW